MTGWTKIRIGPFRVRIGPLLPRPVGGVYLSGAGEALKSLGPITGFAYDRASGRFVLISKEAGEVGLPPLRMDDVVTVFRSVYDHGEAPWVTIDPDPKDPQGPRMIVRHGDATADTHVGWILFEADRVMKVYSLGRTTSRARNSGPDFRIREPARPRLLPPVRRAARSDLGALLDRFRPESPTAGPRAAT